MSRFTRVLNPEEVMFCSSLNMSSMEEGDLTLLDEENFETNDSYVVESGDNEAEVGAVGGTIAPLHEVESVTDDEHHLQNSDHDEKTKEKKINGKKQQSKKEEGGLKNEPLDQKGDLKSKKDKNKKKTLKEKKEDNTFIDDSKEATMKIDEDSKPKIQKRGKKEQALATTDPMESVVQGVECKLTMDTKKKQLKVEEPKLKKNKANLKESSEKVNNEKGKSKTDNTAGKKDTKGSEPKVTGNKTEVAAKSAKGKQTSTANDLKKNRKPEEVLIKDDTGIEEQDHVRPKRNVERKNYAEPKPATAAKKKKETVGKQAQENHSTEHETGTILDNPPKTNTKANPKPKEKNITVEKGKKVSQQEAPKKNASHRK